MTQDIDSEYIDTVEALEAFCASLQSKPYIAIDTEFLRERTYRPELCLVQIKHESFLACIDTIAIKDLSSLNDLLLNTAVTKVFHAASQDQEIFYQLTRKVPTPLFDTQIAAPLLGYNEQIGYGNLVKEHLGVELAKSHTRADWTRRPLPKEQISYALDDVIYLEQLYLDFHAKLETLGRLDWLRPEFAEWEKPERYDQPAAERWKKIRNIQRYKGPALSVIQKLAEWRELKARELNLPRNWLMKDDVLVSLGQQLPDSDAELGHIRSLDRKTRERHGKALLAVIDTARKEEPEPLPPFSKKKKLDAASLARVQLLNAWVHQRASELDIAPGLLAPIKELEQLTSSDGNHHLAGWRESLLGEDLRSLLSGKVQVSATKKGLILTSAT